MQVQLPAATSQTCEAGNSFIWVPQPGRMVDCHLKYRPLPAQARDSYKDREGERLFLSNYRANFWLLKAYTFIFLASDILSVKTSCAPSWTMGEIPNVPC